MSIKFVIQNHETRKFWRGIIVPTNKWNLDLNMAKIFSTETEALDDMIDKENKEDFDYGHFEIKKFSYNAGK